MAIPDFQTLMLPVLRQLGSGEEQAPASVREAVALVFKLSNEELATLLPSGRQTTFANRVAWALGYLKQAGLVESPRRGMYRVTTRGKVTLGEPIERIDIQYLMRFPEFVAFRTASTEDSEPAPSLAKVAVEGTPLTPDEQIRQGYTRLQSSLAAQLLERVRQASPKFFEELVVELLVAMGYGGSREDASAVVGRGGDEGIDGIIKEDRLGLDTIYIQAKRWKDNVGRPEIQRFAGALQGQRARKGVFLTTSTFTADARSYAAGLQTTIVLIDGAQLAQLMLEFGIGVSQAGLVKLWKLDEDYFVEE
ncbi:MAG: restriction endonuclease [Nitrospirae bacterium]|nr:restriction endonuclease [Nitrospirota bacterium]MBU6482831.1 restriction endonuclease [Nitrospirota bacterium]MDE3042610.1 restriction endonuclease [Nitrospirota bacterium]